VGHYWSRGRRRRVNYAEGSTADVASELMWPINVVWWPINIVWFPPNLTREDKSHACA
jgi:hypothetical protein